MGRNSILNAELLCHLCPYGWFSKIRSHVWIIVSLSMYSRNLYAHIIHAGFGDIWKETIVNTLFAHEKNALFEETLSEKKWHTTCTAGITGIHIFTYLVAIVAIQKCCIDYYIAILYIIRWQIFICYVTILLINIDSECN